MRYLVYARVSPRGSGHAEETSLPDQVRHCERWVAAHGGEVAGVIQDEHYSGGTLSRPGIRQVLADLHAGPAWDALVVYRLNRLSRSVGDAAPLLRDLLAAGRGVVSVLESLDFSSPMGRLQIHVLLAVAQWQRETISEDTRNRMVGIAERGGWPPGRVPLGYRRRGPRDNVLVVEPRGAETVRAIYRDYLAGTSVPVLARRHGLGRYASSTVCDLLRNPVYRGAISYGGQEYRGLHEPLVAADTWAAVQARLPGQRRPRRALPARQRRQALLTGLLFCRCGAPMSSKLAYGRGRRPYAYYSCPMPECDLRPVPAEELERWVIEQVRLAQFDRRSVGEMVRGNREAREAFLRQARPELSGIERARKDVAAERDRLERALLDGLVGRENAAHFNARFAALSAELARLESRRAELAAAVDDDCVSYVDAEAIVASLKSVGELMDATADPSSVRAILANAIQRVDRTGPETYDLRLLAVRLSPGLASRNVPGRTEVLRLSRRAFVHVRGGLSCKLSFV